MTSLSDLFDLAEKGCVLVFPTEESARGFAVRYVIERKKGLKASSAIAFDTFASAFFPGISSLDSASEIDRILFSNYAAENLADSFRYFASSSYPEVKERMAPYIKSMLQNLPDAMSVEKRSKHAEHDLQLIKREYAAFMDRLGLYEPSFEDIAIPEFDTDYALIMPSAFPKEERIASALKDNPRIRIIDDAPCSDLRLRKFGSEKEEIRALFCSIRDLLDKGVPYSDIVIATAAEDRLRPYLEQEAYLFGIPVEFVSGRSPLSSASGAFLMSLSDIYSSSYSLDSLKAFFLNPAIPFRDHEGLLRFIEFSISSSITSAPSFDKDRYIRVPSSQGGDWYRTLRFTLDKLMGETDSRKILQHIHALMAGLLVQEEFNGNEDDADVYSFAMYELEGFLRAAGRAEAAGYRLSKPLFPLFISYLEGTRYVPRKKSGGVRIYPYTQDAAIPARHRFIIALNNEESSVRVRKARFLSDYEIAVERRDDEISSSILGSYFLFSDNLYLSAASQTYAGFALPLPYVKAEDCMSGIDSWRAERSHAEAARIYPLQRAGYERAASSSLRKISSMDDFTYDKRGHGTEGTLRLSFSSYNAYVQCPFVYALKYVFGLDKVQSFTPSALDTAEMGTRLHRILERYYRGEGSDPEKDIPRLFEDEMEGWKNGDGLQPFSPRATDLIIANLRSVYLDNLIAISRGMDSISIPVDDGLEIWVDGDFSEEGFALSGKIDRLARALDGESFIVFDYKSRSSFDRKGLERQSFQMYIYKLLVEKRYGKAVSHSYFVTLRDGNIGELPFTLSDADVLADLRSAAQGIASGDWHAISSDENCEGCAYRQICRRRFVVR